jgi:hypothetical protein
LAHAGRKGRPGVEKGREEGRRDWAGRKEGKERARGQREEGSVLGWAGFFYSFLSFVFLTH